MYKIFHVNQEHLLLLRQCLNDPIFLCSIEKNLRIVLLSLSDFKSVLEVYAKLVCSGSVEVILKLFYALCHAFY